MPLGEPVAQPPAGEFCNSPPPLFSPVTVRPAGRRVCACDGQPLKPNTPADWLDGRQEGAPMAATPRGDINRRPSNAAVKPSPLEVQALRPHGNRGSAARSDSAQLMVEPFRPTGTPTFPLHRPSELAHADVRRTAVRVRNCVSYATDFVWDSLLPSAPPIADPPLRAPLDEGL